GTAANARRHEFRDEGVYRYELNANADARQKTPQRETKRIVLKRHDEGRGAVPEKRHSEDRTPPEAVRDEAEERCADKEAEEQRGHEARHTLGAKETRSSGR